jgi:hypothetical protein
MSRDLRITDWRKQGDRNVSLRQQHHSVGLG